MIDKDKCQVCKAGVAIKDENVIKEFGLICEGCLRDFVNDIQADFNRKRKLEEIR